MSHSYENLGSPDPTADRTTREAQKRTLEMVEETIGEEMYKTLIRKLHHGEELSPEEKEVLAKISDSSEKKPH